MPDNIYSAPRAKLVEEPAHQEPQFYVVAARKFWILFLASFTTYQFYWFYRHWSNYRLRTGESLWPAPRAIFSIFFANSLFQKIDNKIRQERKQQRWSPAAAATAFVFLVLANNICGRLAEYDVGMPYTGFAQFALLWMTGWPLFRAQKAANTACSDPAGVSNSRLTSANAVWLLIFAALWIVAIAGVYSWVWHVQE